MKVWSKKKIGRLQMLLHNASNNLFTGYELRKAIDEMAHVENLPDFVYNYEITVSAKGLSHTARFTASYVDVKKEMKQ